VGFFEGNNLGDTSILKSMVNLFRGYVENDNIAVITRFFPTKTALDEYKTWGIVCIPLRSILRILQRLIISNIIIGGGGHASLRGLFWPNGVSLLLITFNRLLGGRPVVLGIGADYPSHPFSRWIIKTGYSMATVCTCRDSHSANVLKKIGVPKHKIIITADFAFSLKLGRECRRQRSVENPIRVLIVPGRDLKYMKSSTTIMLKLLKYLKESNLFYLEFMAHDWRQDYDIAEIHYLIDLAGLSKTRVHVPKTFSQLQELYRSSNIVISNRLHPLILAAVYGALPIAVSSSSIKVKYMANLLGIPSLNNIEMEEFTFDSFRSVEQEIIIQLINKLENHIEYLSNKAIHNREIALEAWRL